MSQPENNSNKRYFSCLALTIGALVGLIVFMVNTGAASCSEVIADYEQARSSFLPQSQATTERYQRCLQAEGKAVLPDADAKPGSASPSTR